MRHRRSSGRRRRGCCRDPSRLSTRRRASLHVEVGIVLECLDQALPHLGIVDQDLARIVDQLDVVGIDPAQERLEGVGRTRCPSGCRCRRRLTGRLRDGRLHLVAPERPIFLPRIGNVVLLEAGLRQHVLPVLDVQGLLLEREGVVGPLAGLAVGEVGRLHGAGREAILHRPDDVGEVLELAVERPFARRLHIVGVGIGDVGRRTGVERCHRLWHSCPARRIARARSSRRSWPRTS